jgi:hypothetical protein
MGVNSEEIRKKVEALGDAMWRRIEAGVPPELRVLLQPSDRSNFLMGHAGGFWDGAKFALEHFDQIKAAVQEPDFANVASGIGPF